MDEDVDEDQEEYEKEGDDLDQQKVDAWQVEEGDPAWSEKEERRLDAHIGH